MGAGHKKTREQKIAADLRRQHFAYTETASHSISNASAISTHSYIKHDILKTFLLTAFIIGFQIILFILLKNHIIVLPMVSY
ncbi:MAG: hypothetical protein AAB583_04190 [Patescibacteria group bacterium]